MSGKSSQSPQKKKKKTITRQVYSLGTNYLEKMKKSSAYVVLFLSDRKESHPGCRLLKDPPVSPTKPRFIVRNSGLFSKWNSLSARKTFSLVSEVEPIYSCLPPSRTSQSTRSLKICMQPWKKPSPGSEWNMEAHLAQSEKSNPEKHYCNRCTYMSAKSLKPFERLFLLTKGIKEWKLIEYFQGTTNIEIKSTD